VFREGIRDRSKSLAMAAVRLGSREYHVFLTAVVAHSSLKSDVCCYVLANEQFQTFLVTVSATFFSYASYK